MTDEQTTTVTLSPHDLSTVRKGLDLLLKRYKRITKDVKRLGESLETETLDIEDAAEAQVAAVGALIDRLAAPPDQLDAFTSGEPDDRPLHLRLFDQGYNVRSDAIESDWNDLDRENVTDWLERRRTANPKAAPPSILVSYRAVP